jgi:hypothetical protein
MCRSTSRSMPCSGSAHPSSSTIARGLAPSDRAGVDGAFEALFFEPSVIDWLDQGASITWEIGALAAALPLWRDYGWRVSVPLAAAGWILAKSHVPPYGALAGLALGIAVWKYLTLVEDQFAMAAAGPRTGMPTALRYSLIVSRRMPVRRSIWRSDHPRRVSAVSRGGRFSGVDQWRLLGVHRGHPQRSRPRVPCDGTTI